MTMGKRLKDACEVVVKDGIPFLAMPDGTIIPKQRDLKLIAPMDDVTEGRTTVIVEMELALFVNWKDSLFDEVLSAQRFQTMLDHCSQLDEQYTNSDDPNVGLKLGHYDQKARRIMFYGVSNTSVQLDGLRAYLNEVWIPYSLTVDQPDEPVTNVRILVEP